MQLFCQIKPASEDWLDMADQLASQLGLTVSTTPTSSFILHLNAHGLSLSAPSSGNPLQVDFVSGKNAHRRLYGGGRNQPLARALGFKQGVSPVIIDATAGFARDAFVMASLGANVTLIEQHPIIAALISDGLTRGNADPAVAPIIQRMSLHRANAVDYLQTLSQIDWPDTIYLDPMYPQRDKTALVKKEMQLLHQLVGTDQHSHDLLDIACQRARQRIVVKRPKSAAFLAQIKPVASITSKNTRYDIYKPRLT
ncbi:N6-adenine-specific methylase [Methylophaga frappieri]|uniref:Ribosomal RNA small subunit methyltransferase J n=1 Tax=Methylophaga frappieri (strain ATCC BAA-2434 / DSM 25690 / JAM7) TaxID=754477 RepID=I1YIQ4_METFJ|nr:class I SAM-dependent methyltransferase [Methylophaga frappieri]AFJ02797.1 N6-adenine-specific methylase [Methylophaga frappieri]